MQSVKKQFEDEAYHQNRKSVAKATRQVSRVIYDSVWFQPYNQARCNIQELIQHNIREQTRKLMQPVTSPPIEKRIQ